MTAHIKIILDSPDKEVDHVKSLCCDQKILNN